MLNRAALMRLRRAIAHRNFSHSEPASPDLSQKSGERIPFSGLRRSAPPSSDEMVARWTLAVALFTAALVGTSIASDVFAYRTLQAISGQLSEMKNGSAQTDQQIAVNKEIAANAKLTLIAEERAWVAPLDASLDGTPQAGKAIDAIVDAQNVGKEPATQLSFVASTQVVRSVDTDVLSLYMKSELDADLCLLRVAGSVSNVLYPSNVSTRQQRLQVEAEKMTDAVVNGSDILVLTGCFTYVSQQRLHHSAFCFFYSHAPKIAPQHLGICTSGNKAD